MGEGWPLQGGGIACDNLERGGSRECLVGLFKKLWAFQTSLQKERQKGTEGR